VYLPGGAQLNLRKAELIFYNGSILTMEGDAWEAGDRYPGRQIGRGRRGGACAARSGTQLVDLDGHSCQALSMHTHLFNDAEYMG
jgi:hypothetical protein